MFQTSGRNSSLQKFRWHVQSLHLCWEEPGCVQATLSRILFAATQSSPQSRAERTLQNMGKYISLAALRFTAHLTDPKKGQPTLSKTPFSVTGLTTGRQVPALATGRLTSWHDRSGCSCGGATWPGASGWDWAVTSWHETLGHFTACSTSFSPLLGEACVICQVPVAGVSLRILTLKR